MHTWYSTIRVAPDEVGQRLQRYERLLISLTQLEQGLGCPIPHTIVVRKGAGSGYWCDPMSSVVTRERITSVASVLDDIFYLNDEEDVNSIVAVWMSERHDMKGNLWTLEYFTREGLEAFVKANSPYMSGILQRFISTRLHLGINEVNQSLVGYYNFVDDTIAVERRFLRDCFLNSCEHPTVRASLFPPVAVLGKVDLCKTLPISPAALYDVLAERIDLVAGDTTRLIAAMMGRLASALERSRAERCGCDVLDVRPVGYMVAEFRFNSVDDKLYLINVLHVRHLGDTMSCSTGFELTRLTPTNVKMRHVQSVGEDEFMVLESQLQLCVATSVRSSEWIGTEALGYDPSLEFNEEAPMMDGPPLRTPIGAPARFSCPNCDLLCSREEMRRVPFSFMVGQFREAHFLRRGKTTSSSLPLEAAEEAAMHMDEGYWASLPTVLKRLNVDVIKLSSSNAWLSRSVALCGMCCNAMGYLEAEEAISTVTKPYQQEEERARYPRPPPPTCLRSDVIDSFVTTDLQARHRELRRVERNKYAYVTSLRSRVACASRPQQQRSAAVEREDRKPAAGDINNNSNTRRDNNLFNHRSSTSSTQQAFSPGRSKKTVTASRATPRSRAIFRKSILEQSTQAGGAQGTLEQRDDLKTQQQSTDRPLKPRPPARNPEKDNASTIGGVVGSAYSSREIPSFEELLDCVERPAAPAPSRSLLSAAAMEDAAAAAATSSPRGKKANMKSGSAAELIKLLGLPHANLEKGVGGDQTYTPSCSPLTSNIASFLGGVRTGVSVPLTADESALLYDVAGVKLDAL